jgi:uncharacterized membrane protein YvbJ
MKVCPSCKVRYSEDNHFCSRCGINLVTGPLEKQETPKKGINLNLLLILGLSTIPILLLLVVFFFYLNQNPIKPLPPYQQEKLEGTESTKKKT